MYEPLMRSILFADWCLFPDKFVSSSHSNSIFWDKTKREQVNGRAEETVSFYQYAGQQRWTRQLLRWDPLKYIGHLVRQAKRKVRRWQKGIRGKRQRKVMPAISLRRKKRRTKSVHVHCHHHHHHHHYHFGNNSPQAPRASPENSDIGSSPTRQNRLMVPNTNGSLGPSNDSLHSITYCTENLSRLEPIPSRSRCKSSPHHHVVTTLSIHRASSINYPTTNSKDTRQNMALAKLTAETALNRMTDVPTNKLQERWKDLCLGDTLNKYSKLPPVKTGSKISGKSIQKWQEWNHVEKSNQKCN